ncbi:unnamed protein product [Calypogeia fissa]
MEKLKQNVDSTAKPSTSQEQVEKMMQSDEDPERPPVGLIYDERMCLHDNPSDPSHVYSIEQPARITKIFEELRSAGILEKCKRIDATEATIPELEAVHTEEHIAYIREISSKKQQKRKLEELYDEHSIFVNKDSFHSALLAAGSVVKLARLVAQGELRAGAAVVRPPGHHAEKDRAMGFCIFNNVAVAAHALIHGNPAQAQNVLIVDWDVHHGNGIQKIFWDDPKVLFFSVHRKGLYPERPDDDFRRIGEGSGKGYNINVPLDRGQTGFTDLDYLTVFDEILMPVATEFKPDIVLVCAGFDAAQNDDMGQCKVTPAGYSEMTKRLMTLANGRLVLALEGGYEFKSLSKSFLACMKVMLGYPPEVMEDRAISLTTADLVTKVRRNLARYWPQVFSTSVEIPDGEIPAQDVEEDSAKDANAGGMPGSSSLPDDSLPSLEEENDDEIPAQDVEEDSAKDANAGGMPGSSNLPDDSLPSLEEENNNVSPESRISDNSLLKTEDANEDVKLTDGNG